MAKDTEAATDADWVQNKDYMLAQEEAGKTTAGHDAWLTKWRAAGSPNRQSGMSTGVQVGEYGDYGKRVNPTYTNEEMIRMGYGGQFLDAQGNNVNPNWENLDQIGMDSDYSFGGVPGAMPDWKKDGSAGGIENEYDGLDDYEKNVPNPPDTGGPTPPVEGDPFDPNGGSGAPPNTVRPDIPKPPDETEIKPWEPSDSQDSAKTWNWDYFAPKQAGDGQWGGYDEDYGVFERYQPGQDSPWGMPDIEGGNQNFYQQQFNNMLRDEQGYRSQQRAAQLRGQKSEQAKQKAIADGTANINYEDMWESMGITPNQAVQQDVDAEGNPSGGAYDWSFNSALGGLGKGSTNQEILNASLGLLDPATAKMLGDGYHNGDNYDTWKDSKYWSQFTNPTDLKSAFQANQGPDGQSPEWAAANHELFSKMFTRNDLTTPVGGGPSAAPGYASPI